VDVLRAKPDPDQPGGNPPQEGEAGEEPKKKRGRDRALSTLSMQYATDDAFLKEELQPLRHLCRPGASLLNPMQIFICYPVFTQRRSQQIRCGDRVLNRKIDSDAAHGGHRMCCVADA
jgi:hypothetical protein